MQQTEILREPLSTIGSVGELTESLHSQAKELLGYSCTDKSNAATDSKLRATLDRLGIAVLNEQSVLRYQAETLSEQMIRNGPSGSYDWSWRSDPSWQRTDLKKYGKPVPDFAIERAMQIKRECPEVEFWVDELSTAPDPFLIAHIGGEGYYVACWEEARFEATL